MALRGDDEIDSLLDMMGGGSTGQAPTITPGNRNTSDDAPAPKKLKSDGQQQGSREKSKKKVKKKKKKSFADARLSQNHFEWPTCKGKRWLYLGGGLLNNCKEYICEDDKSYGSSKCQSCGLSAATHTLHLSRSCWAEGIDDSVRDLYPPSIVSLAQTVVATRNVRCLIGEYYAESNLLGGSPRDCSKDDLFPALNSNPFSCEKIASNLDIWVGTALSCTKTMMAVLSKLNRSQSKVPGIQEGYRRVLISSVSTSDAQLVQDKVSAMVNTVQEYKTTIEANFSAKGVKELTLVEKRLVALASCDAIYYRCYYAAAVACGSTSGTNVISAMIPHPPTYFSCPGLAWDINNAGVESLRVFLGESNHVKYDEKTAAPLLWTDTQRGPYGPFRENDGCIDENATKHMLLESLGLGDCLCSSSTRSDSFDKEVPNPLLALWQSRFLENIRHLWTTKYSKEMAFREIRKSDMQWKTNNGAQVANNNNQEESLLKLHETLVLSPAVARWRDSIRDYPANFYAYAAPTSEALKAISDCCQSGGIEQIIEAGAGTGYWSSQILSHFHKQYGKCGREASAVPLVAPYDVAPPSKDNSRASVSNEYHGNIPTFMAVQEAESLSKALPTPSQSNSKVALLLCYPPPGCDMAHKTLTTHIKCGGRAVIHVGEWQGLTGDANFEALLTEHFYCNEDDVLQLPMWGTDATYLTIWRRKDGEYDSEDEDLSHSPAIGFCSMEGCTRRPDHNRGGLGFKRCKYARCLQYCTQSCYEEHWPWRRAMLALHMIQVDSLEERFHQDDFWYHSDAHFVKIEEITPSTEKPSAVERPKKKRKKKRH